jgi:hypothetical protein
VAQTRTFTVANQAAALGAGGRLAATVSAAGYRLVNALITLQAPVPHPCMLTARPMVNLRHFLRRAAGQQDNPPVDELVMALFDDQTITGAWTGSSEFDRAGQIGRLTAIYDSSLLSYPAYQSLAGLAAEAPLSRRRPVPAN